MYEPQARAQQPQRHTLAVPIFHDTAIEAIEPPFMAVQDDAGSPVSHLPNRAQHSHQECRLPSKTLTASGLAMHPTEGILGVESGMAGSPAESCTRQAFSGSSAASSPTGRMSLGRTRSKHLSRETREDTPDPRPPPQSYSGPPPSAQSFLQQHPTRAPSSPPWRCRKPAAAAIAEVPGAAGSTQPGHAAEPSSQPHRAMHSSTPPDGSHAPAQQQVPMEEASSVVGVQPQATATKWALKFRMPPQHGLEAPGAAAAPADRHLSETAEDPARPSSSHNLSNMEQASAGAEAASLPSRLRHVQLSGNVHTPLRH